MPPLGEGELDVTFHADWSLGVRHPHRGDLSQRAGRFPAQSTLLPCLEIIVWALWGYEGWRVDDALSIHADCTLVSPARRRFGGCAFPALVFEVLVLVGGRRTEQVLHLARQRLWDLELEADGLFGSGASIGNADRLQPVVEFWLDATRSPRSSLAAFLLALLHFFLLSYRVLF